MGWGFQGGQNIKSRIIVVIFSKRVHAVDNTRRYRERGKGTFFDMASCAEVE